VDNLESLVLEFDGATDDTVDRFADDLEQSGMTALPLAERDAGTAVSVLIGAGTSFIPVLAGLVVTHFKKKPVSVRIKRKGGHNLIIRCDDELEPHALTAVIADFLTDE
jgi:hypothetical protein